MAYHFEDDPANNIIRVVYEGPYTDDDLIDSYYDFKNYKTNHAKAHVILDFTEVTGIVISHEAIKTHTYMPAEVPSDRFLIAVSPRPTMRGIARMIELMSRDRRNLRVVFTMGEALQLIRGKIKAAA
jgi:hypothetical protein